MAKRQLMSLPAVVAVVAVVVAAALGGMFAWRAVGQPDAPIDVAPGTTPTDLVSVNGEAISGELVAIFEANGMGHAEAINAAIEQVLMRQAAQRLGLEATEEEAAEHVRRIEAGWANLNDDQHQQVEAILIAQGLPVSDLAADPRMLAFGRAAATTARLRSFLLERLAVAQLIGVPPDEIGGPEEAAVAKEGLDDGALRDVYNQIAIQQELEQEVARFVQQERENAEIAPVSSP